MWTVRVGRLPGERGTQIGRPIFVWCGFVWVGRSPARNGTAPVRGEGRRFASGIRDRLNRFDRRPIVSE